MKTLDMLKPGENAVITGINGQNTSLRRRLLDMGLTLNTKVSLVREAPFGDPIELEVRGYSLTIRKSDAQLIEVK
ncbi:FeoA family protein [Succinatimonas hippei]|uniref:FeoA family protein n=1 Tax=Succinatimonas hippei TaxID=626938 RepID=UPI002012DD01|nr:FeoA family protein [Succinatimonas hippei]MCL1603176.1 ferrous iron transport protein A [Succinatimonas hippei]MDM8119265.1 FeoA family protein [Succinatimonas hippei]